jgi:DNA-directed RNA polymerase specialized sigma24 family protein
MPGERPETWEPKPPTASAGSGDEEALRFEELATALRAGDAAVWMQVFTRLLPRAREAIQRAFGAEEVRSENAGGQAVDSACRTIYRNLRAGKFELNDWSDLAGLFVRIAINKCIDKRREQHRLITNVSNGPSDSHQPLEVPAPGGLPIDQVIRAEANEEFHRVVDLVRRRLKRVNPKYVSIFNLRLAGGDTTEQIAQKVKCSEATVKRAWAYATQLVRRLLDESVIDELVR